jgi:N-succinyldiaminopimelate aminotransferase
LNTGLSTLHPYPFEKLGQLFEGLSPPDQPVIPLTIGEPQHAPPSRVTELLSEHAALGGAVPCHSRSP